VEARNKTVQGSEAVAEDIHLEEMVDKILEMAQKMMVAMVPAEMD
jgi:hypothetical protein